MKKRILGLGIAASVVIALVASGTWAVFTDTETTTDNVFTAGTIDISLDPTTGQDVATVEGYVDLKPCQTGYIPVCIHNDGTNPCEVWKHIANVENREHGIVDAEAKFYAEHPESENWLISNWIHYDLLAYRSLGYSWFGEVETLVQEPISVVVEDGDCAVTWTIDFPLDDNEGNGSLVAGLVIALDGDGQGPAFQVHNNDGTCAAFPWGTWLYSPWDPTPGGGWFGWHSGEEDWNTPVADMDWISASGERYNFDNTGNVLTISIDKCRLVEDFHWKLYLAIGSGFYGNPYQQSFIPDAASWGDPIVNMAIPNYEYADLAEQVLEILETEGFTLTGTPWPVECNYIYLGVLEPCQTMCVIQSYHLDIEVGNWGQSDRVFFDMEFLAQQLEGSPLPPGPELTGHGRP